MQSLPVCGYNVPVVKHVAEGTVVGVRMCVLVESNTVRTYVVHKGGGAVFARVVLGFSFCFVLHALMT